MKKLFYSLTFIVVSIPIFVYVTLFTPLGNSFVSSLIETNVNEQKIVEVKFDKFLVTTSEINIKADIDSNSKVVIEGKFDIFAKELDINVDIDVKELSKLQNFTGEKLNGPLKLKANAKGSQELLNIIGESNIFTSDTTFDATLVKFEPKTANIKILNAKIQNALYMVNQPSFAKGNLDLIVNVKDANVKNLDGIVSLKIYDGIVNNKSVNKEFSLKLKDKIIYSAKLDAVLLQEFVNSKLKIKTSLADITIKKALLNINTLDAKSDINLSVKDLSKFYDILQMKLNGAFEVNANINKVKDIIALDVNSNILKSKTILSATLDNNELKDITLDIKKADIKYALFMLNQPSYAKGYLDVKGKIKSASLDKLDGVITTKIYDGLVNNSVVNKAFELKLNRKAIFKALVNTKLIANTLTSVVDVDSTYANIDTKKTIVRLKDKTVITSDYLVNVADLSKLIDVTGMKMRGSIKIEGEAKIDEHMLITGNSKLLGGTLDYELLDDDFTAKLKKIQVKNGLHMMYFPEIFNSNANFDVNYNLKTQQGKAIGLLNEGRILKNKYSTMIDTFAKFDITKEVYESFTLNSIIDKTVIRSIAKLKSKLTKINLTKSIFDYSTLITNSYVEVDIKGIKFDTSIKGNVTSPKIKIHGNKAAQAKVDAAKKEAAAKVKKLKDKAKKELEEKLKSKKAQELKKKIEEKLKSKKVQDDLKKKFKSLF